MIGKKGEDVEKLRQDLTKQMGVPMHINIEEIRKPELDAMLVAQSVAQQLERRVMFRRAMRSAPYRTPCALVPRASRFQVSGRLGGAEIARTEWYREGRVPLHTLRADIDYATYEAHTTYGVIGVKVWIFKGEVIGGRQEELKPVKHPLLVKKLLGKEYANAATQAYEVPQTNDRPQPWSGSSW